MNKTPTNILGPSFPGRCGRRMTGTTLGVSAFSLLLALGCSGEDESGAPAQEISANREQEQDSKPSRNAAPDDETNDEQERAEERSETDSTEDASADEAKDVEFVAAGDERKHRAPASASDDASWTVLVYLNGDNDLEEFSLTDVAEMADVGSGSKLNIVVQMDRADRYSAGELGSLGDFTSVKRFVVNEGTLEEVDDLGELNMGESQTLADFVEWGLSNYEAGRYALVLWDHGGGWNAFGPDDSHQKDALTLPEIGSALDVALTGAGRDTKLDLIGFDACLMATFETAEGLRPYASYLLASQETEPGTGWDWTALEVLRDNPGATASELGTEIVKRYEPHVGAVRDATLSLIELDAMGPLHAAFTELVEALSEVSPSSVGQVRAASPELAPAYGASLVDLAQLATDLRGADERLEAPVSALLSALDDVVVTNYHGADAPQAHGLSLYFPASPRAYDQAYVDVLGIEVWRSYLKKYLDAGSELATGPAFTNPDSIGTLGYDAESELLYLSGELSPGSADQIIEAKLHFGVSVEGYLILLGNNSGQWDDTRAVGWWDLTAFAGQQGEIQAPCYYFERYSSEAGTYSITTPMLHNGERALFYELTLDEQYNRISEGFYGEVNGAFGEVIVESGTLQPILLAMDASGELLEFAYDEAFDASQPIDFFFEMMEPGMDVMLALEVVDYGGNSAIVYNVGTL